MVNHIQQGRILYKANGKDQMSFVERYGPWAVVAGASEGTGRAFARRIAANGLPCILIARREDPLTALADEIRVLRRTGNPGMLTRSSTAPEPDGESDGQP